MATDLSFGARALLEGFDAGKARLIGAAVETFAAKGFHATSTRDIAIAAGMSPAAVYVHYRSKEELLYAISESGHRRILDLVRDGVTGEGDPASRLRAFVRAYATAHAYGHTVARIVNYELRALSEEHYTEIAELRRETAELVRALIADGVAEGVFDTPDPEMTALALLSLGIDVARWYRDGGSWSPADVADHYALLAARMVGLRS